MYGGSCVACTIGNFACTVRYPGAACDLKLCLGFLLKDTRVGLFMIRPFTCQHVLHVVHTLHVLLYFFGVRRLLSSIAFFGFQA